MNTASDSNSISSSASNAVKPSSNKIKINLSIKNIVQEYPKLEGGVNRVVGPSGCGKSTILRMMGGVRPFNAVTPTSGQIIIDEQVCHGPHDDAVMVFQRYANRPDLNVFDNVAFPFSLQLWREKIAEKEWRDQVKSTLAAVGLSDKQNLFPAQLSGGQNQRVALARALVLKPRILLMDEPFGALDAQIREEMQVLLHKLHQSNPCLVMFVTHDVTEAMLLGDRVIVLSTQPARIADDFSIFEPRARTQAWLRSSDAHALQERVLTRLHEASGRGQVRVSV
jgi:ABC-type nitrate/sulfonate/bicarbonate transport system ATPase subunit